mmetsp:Transcript_9001/g.19330  ORF Transcript_9001/g.19330 Transcript_9001/m.19330 type:complete len:1231 (-) Transcript_9001:1802-5494(-)|eukprot:CAMPEP_0202897604 /NCGR_PEP_ID=MMETSP1392-20130828/6322_1 /ASSEMBLY_ACC=CAM_ASM_000868 /TAXON_ID=225041 /ORGANISM="Chlamydomonas chlamydogama, Strain SAG 11-48b" /LENGTH=1230 /DNA_ID=CAMNT_0049583289 /DNA_START=60 /DNA_END=3752 /DNA_ORIENTATION=+
MRTVDVVGLHDQRIAGLFKDSLSIEEEDHGAYEAYVGAKAYLQAHFDAHAQHNKDDHPSLGVVDTDEDARQACLLFVARCLSANKTSSYRQNLSLPVAKIVATANTNLFDFFRELPVVLGRLAPYLEGQGLTREKLESESNVKEWQKTLVSLTLLSKKYKDLVSRYLHLDLYKQVVLRLGWIMFLVLKSKLLPPFPDLVSCMNLLACVLNLLVSHAPKISDVLVPKQHQQGPLDTLSAISADMKTDPKAVQSLMISVDALLGQVLIGICFEWKSTTRSHPAPNIKPSCSYFAGLVTDVDRMNRCIAAFEREYGAIYSKQGEIDERDFLFTDYARLASPSVSPGSTYQAAMKKLQKLAPVKPGMQLGPGSFFTSPAASAQQQQQQPKLQQAAILTSLGLQSPLPMMSLGHGPASTPVSETMAAAAWLRSVLASSPAEPSPALERYFEGTCDERIASAIAKRAAEMTLAVFPDEKPSSSMMMGFNMLQPSINAERRVETTKLYYHALEVVLTAEERATGQTNFSGMLTAIKFHRGLMACCMEIVIAAYRMVSSTFPHVLDCIKLTAFDLSKMIPSFVKHMPSLPRELKRHLFMVEEKILESLGWEVGSPLYTILMLRPSTSPTPQEQQGGSRCNSQPCSPARPAALLCAAQGAQPGAHSSAACRAASDSAPVVPPSPSKRTSQQANFSSPMKRVRCESTAGAVSAVPVQHFSDPLPLAVGRPPNPGATSESSHLAHLHEFLRKVLKLMSYRLAVLCESFDFSPLDQREVFQKVLETLEHVLYQETYLFYNRHIDQIILSALYGYCKVHKLNQVSFREIINQYRKQGQVSQTVFRAVNLEQSNPGLVPKSKGDIIAFYNQCFVPAMKQFLLRTAEHMSGHHGPGLPPMPPHPHARSSPAKPLAARLPVHPPAAQQAPGAQVRLDSFNSGRAQINGFFPALPRSVTMGTDTDQAMDCGATKVQEKLVVGSAPASLGFICKAQGVAPAGKSRQDSAPVAMPLEQRLAPTARAGRGRERIPSGLATLLAALDTQQEQENRAKQAQANEAKATGCSGPDCITINTAEPQAQSPKASDEDVAALPQSSEEVDDHSQQQPQRMPSGAGAGAVPGLQPLQQSDLAAGRSDTGQLSPSSKLRSMNLPQASAAGPAPSAAPLPAGVQRSRRGLPVVAVDSAVMDLAAGGSQTLSGAWNGEDIQLPSEQSNDCGGRAPSSNPDVAASAMAVDSSEDAGGESSA